MNNFNLINADTDSILISKPDNSAFTTEEQQKLLKELNTLFPELIKFEDDGYFSKVIVVKAKNYVMKDFITGKVKIKGSAFKDQKKEIILRQFLNDMVGSILEDDINYENLRGIYSKYLNEISDIQDIKLWCSKKTVTDKILKCAGHQDKSKEEKKALKIRKNETDVWDAIQDEIVSEGDKIYLYPVSYNHIETGRVGKTGKPLKDMVHNINSLKLLKNWNNDHDRAKLKKRLDATLDILSKILNTVDISQN